MHIWALYPIWELMATTAFAALATALTTAITSATAATATAFGCSTQLLVEFFKFTLFGKTILYYCTDELQMCV